MPAFTSAPSFDYDDSAREARDGVVAPVVVRDKAKSSFNPTKQKKPKPSLRERKEALDSCPYHTRWPAGGDSDHAAAVKTPHETSCRATLRLSSHHPAGPARDGAESHEWQYVLTNKLTVKKGHMVAFTDFLLRPKPSPRADCPAAYAWRVGDDRHIHAALTCASRISKGFSGPDELITDSRLVHVSPARPHPYPGAIELFWSVSQGSPILLQEPYIGVLAAACCGCGCCSQPTSLQPAALLEWETEPERNGISHGLHMLRPRHNLAKHVGLFASSSRRDPTPPHASATITSSPCSLTRRLSPHSQATHPVLARRELSWPLSRLFEEKSSPFPVPAARRGS
nr:unnamed protein product [Digitaria exilis]